MNFNSLVEQILEQAYAKDGIVFRDNNGCCIGVEHGQNINLSPDIIDRIKQIPNLKFYAEGVAAKDPSAEPYMMPFIKKHFPGYSVEGKSWDDITEDKGLGTADVRNNIYWLFANHKFNKLIDKHYSKYTSGSMLDALAYSDHYPKNAPEDADKRKEWIAKHMKAAGFLDKLLRPYSREELSNVMDEIEYSVYPDQEFPDTSTYLGKQVQRVEDDRNQTIYDLMGNGGCCFAGAGHLVELKQQFPELVAIDL